MSTRELVQLTSGLADETDPDAAPYCEWVYFETNEGGNAQVHRMRLDGSGQQNVILGEPAGEPWADYLDELSDDSIRRIVWQVRRTT